MNRSRDRIRCTRRGRISRGCGKLSGGREFQVEPLEDRRMLAAFIEGEVLVQFAPTASASERAAARAAVQGQAAEAIQTAAMRSAGAGVLERISLAKGVPVDRAIQALANRPGVVFAEPNWKLSTAATSNDPYYTTSSRLWGMYGNDSPAASGPTGTTNQFGSQAEKAWDAGFTGSSSVVVGIVDEGIDINHPDLAANIWVNPFEVAGDGIDNDGNGYVDDINGWDFFYGDNTVYNAGEDSHGTHVAGTIGGSGGNGVGVAGVNWNVSMISTKFLGPGGGSTSNAIKAIDYLTDLKTRHGINLVASNNSWGGGGYSSALHSAIIRGANAGILFVAAAGNGGSDGVGDSNDTTANYPSNYSTLQGTTTQRAAAYEAVVAVAALTSSGGLASYSNYGSTTVDIAAPGSSINSTLPGGTYGNYSGTSMATPHVTGAVALYASAYPGASAATIRSAVLNSARPTSSLAGKTVTGGRLDVAAALNAAPPVGISVRGGSVIEGNAGTTSLVFTVSLSATSASTVTVNYATANGSATAGNDYSAATGTLAFAPGETTKTVAVDVIGDLAFEANETFSLVLSGASANATITTTSAVGTITNDDQQAVVSLAIASVSALEGSGTFLFTVTLSQATTSKVSVRFATANGTAVAGRTGDYTATSGTLTFNPGETSKTIAVAVQNDAVVEADETFFVDLSKASGATVAVGRGTGTIVNDDGALATQRAMVFAALAAEQSPSTSRRR
ncbi:MAG: S8 family serine peptidase [Pirellulales bacterium]